MSGFTKTGVAAHDQVRNLAEGIRPAAVADVTMNAAGQVANNAEIASCRAVIASCKANNNSQSMGAYINLC
jgi:hypothetical protein